MTSNLSSAIDFQFKLSCSYLFPFDYMCLRFLPFSPFHRMMLPNFRSPAPSSTSSSKRYVGGGPWCPPLQLVTISLLGCESCVKVWYDGEFDKLQFVSKSLRYCQPLLGLIRRLLVLEPKDRLAGDEVPMLPAFVVIYFLFLLSFCCLQVYKHPWVQDQPPETPLRPKYHYACTPRSVANGKNL